MAITVGTVETLDDVPPRVSRGLPDCLRLGPSALNQNRIGVWANGLLSKGQRFGPFVGEKKKRSQVTSNVYMWEVYFPSRGWMCVDATDPKKGNWMRYVNWARSSQEQNLFPLEINRAIYYKVLRPIAPGEELLVRYSVEDNPEITAALEEERRRNSPRAKRARRKLLDRAKQAGPGGLKTASETKTVIKEMWDGDEGPQEEAERRASVGPSQVPESAERRDKQDASLVVMDRVDGEDEEEEDDEEEEEEEADDGDEAHQLTQIAQPKSGLDPARSEPPALSLARPLPHPHPRPAPDSATRLQLRLHSPSFAGQEPEVDPDPDLDLDPDPDGDYDPHGESFPCQHCERRFSTRQGLERHVHIHAVSAQSAQVFTCRYCNKSFGSQVGRRRHERRHESLTRKRPGSLAGTSTLLGHAAPMDGLSPDCTSPPSHYIAISQYHGPEMQRKDPGSHADRPFVLDENGESKELHPCKYCNKAFGTHTNMRRHQRRIHERHLLPKGVRRKGMLLQEAAGQKQPLPGESPSTSPPPVYVPSADTEDEVDRDDYVVDISKNISENLSFYIDGKILSTSAVSTCEVIEVDSRSAALFGLDTVIISPNQIGQTLKVEGRNSAAKQASAQIGQPSSKRRTSTPPLIPSLKLETDAGSSAAASSSSSSSFTSSSSNLLVGGLLQQSADSAAFQREKTVYLSPKLKQLLQTQDIQKSPVTVIAESHRLASSLSALPLQAAPGRFKRRTSSPPSSPQLSPEQKLDGCKTEPGSYYALKVPKVESHSLTSSLDKDDGDVLGLAGNNVCAQLSPGNGGTSCNQQPLDLSSSVSRRSDSGVSVSGKALGDSALDLSMTRKNVADPEPRPSPTPQPLPKKRKPNTSMLEKVLMNEYVGLTSSGEDGPSPTLNCLQSSPNVGTESAQPSPPSLTPVTLNPSSPCTSSMTSPTPPPPVLPTIPSPPAMPGSPMSPPSDCSPQRPLPVLSPKVSPGSVESKPSSELGEEEEEEEENGGLEDGIDEDDHIPEPVSSPHLAAEESIEGSLSKSHSKAASADLAALEPDTSLDFTCNSVLNGKINQDLDSVMEKDSDVVSSQQESSSSTSPPPKSPTREPSPPSVPTPPSEVVVKEEQDANEASGTNDAPDAQAAATAAEKPAEKSEAEDFESAYCKTFVCNVCEEPFNSIKELSGHIAQHAADWPFKCEFCVQLFGEAPALLAHRTSLHGVGRIFVCSACSKEFAFLCNLEQHQKDLHPNQTCSHTSVENGKLRPQNYTDPSRAKEESGPDVSDEAAAADGAPDESDLNGNHAEDGKGEEDDGPEDPTEELYTTIKIMASEGGKPKDPDVRLGLNQHYPSYKPPPFPYHSRSHACSVASATNFTTHNIPQTFTTAIRCTKCGNSFDNMPELHKHILACANASDKKRYTPKKNPIPLKQIVKCQNGAASPPAASSGQNAFRRMGQPKRLNFNQEPAGKTKMSALSKKRNQLVQKAISQKNKTATSAKKPGLKVEEEQEQNICPHCSREFTYPASLCKHIALSCPLRPALKKGKKVEVKKEAGDKNMTLRRKVPDAEAPPEPRPLGKTRARSSGALEPETSQATKAKPAAVAAPSRYKRPASFPAAMPASKKSKKGQAQPLPPPSSSSSSSSSEASGEAAARPSSRTQRAGKDAAPKRSAEAKQPAPPPPPPPPPPQQQQPKKEERFQLRSRERAGGPVTRSLQIANTGPSTEGRTEETPSQEPKETQDVLMK